MLLPDINVWLAMAFDGHAHHSAARTWFDSLSEQPCFFCRITQQGFLRLATNQKVFGSNTLTMFAAWQAFDVLMSDERVRFADEPLNIESFWRAETHRQSFSTNVWSDAFLAGFAQAADLTLVTFDKGFSQYKDLRCQILL